MNVQEIYEKYRIPPWLQEHQLRVAAVGRMVCAIHPKADTHSVVLAGLFHDMGNILKTDLSPTGPLVSLIGVENLAYWQHVKDEFREKYGTDEHVATLAIGKEIGFPKEIIGLMGDLSFSNMERIKSQGPIELQILEYSDMRVGPFGVLPMQERISDLKARNIPRWARGEAKGLEAHFDRSVVLLGQLEHDLFQDKPLAPEDINDEAVRPTINELRSFEF